MDNEKQNEVVGYNKEGKPVIMPKEEDLNANIFQWVKKGFEDRLT